MRSFLGLANYCARFIPDFSTLTEPLRNLTKKDSGWIWTEHHQTAFDAVKSNLKASTTLAYFDPEKPTTVVVDASPVGLGAMLLQHDDDGKEFVISFASLSLSPTQQRYSQIERESLAIVFGCEKFHLYLSGAHFQVQTDHKPLLPIFNNPRSVASSRIQRWLLRLQFYSFQVRYQPGKLNPSDYLSRHPLPDTTTKSELRISSITSFGAISLADVRSETQNDDLLQKVKEALLDNSIWDKHTPPETHSSSWNSFKQVRNELSEENEILLKGSQIVIPEALIGKAIQIAHDGHPGIVRTKQILRDKIWFPNLNARIKELVARCMPCQAITPHKQYQPLNMTPLPPHPWHSVAMDFFGPTPSGEYILVVADEYSRYPVTSIVKSTAFGSTSQALLQIFSLFGIPVKIKTDNGPPFNGHDFANFAKSCGFLHHPVTPRWPQANGIVVRQMPLLGKTIRAAMLDNKPWQTVLPHHLMNYRATTHPTTGKSPSLLFFNRSLNTKLPSIIQTSAIDQLIRAKDAEKKSSMKTAADNYHQACPHQLQIGDTVLPKLLQRTKFQPLYDPNPWQVTEINGPQITIQSTTGKTLSRNSSLLKPIKINFSLLPKDIYSNTFDTDYPIQQANIQQPQQANIQQPQQANIQQPQQANIQPQQPQQQTYYNLRNQTYNNGKNQMDSNYHNQTYRNLNKNEPNRNLVLRP